MAGTAHLPEMTAIYAEQIAAGLGSFEDPLPDAAELGRRLAAVRAAGLPAYVAVDGDGRVLGFCWARPFRPSPPTQDGRGFDPRRRPTRAGTESGAPCWRR